jgi:hypothetical protein
MESNPSGKLAAKLAAIMKEIGKVPKTGHNSFFNYDYVTENDLVYAVRQKLADSGIFIFSSVESQTATIIKDEGTGKQSLLTTVCTLHTFVDGESGQSFSVKSQGQGSDIGDKGGYKAITGAMKYFLYKCFMIPTGDDPESDENTDRRGSAHAPQPAPRPLFVASHATDETRITPDAKPLAPATQSPHAQSRSWRDVEIHFGKNKGMRLGDCKNIGWYQTTWQPKPFNGKMNKEDITLRAALDASMASAPAPQQPRSDGIEPEDVPF